MKSKIFISVVCLTFLTAFAVPLHSSIQAEAICNRIMYSHLDSTMRAVLTDSLSDIIVKATKIDVNLLKVPVDTISPIEKTIHCNRERRGICKYIMVASDYEIETGIAYGRFSPKVELVFYKKNELCKIRVDVGLKQFKVLTADNEIVNTYRISDNMLHKLAVMLFPEDDFLVQTLKLQQL